MQADVTELYREAQRRLKAGDLHGASVAFYTGQLRMKALAALDRGEAGLPTVVAALGERLGRPINAWLALDPDRWLLVIFHALRLDMERPFPELEQYAEANQRDSREARRAYVESRAALREFGGRLVKSGSGTRRAGAAPDPASPIVQPAGAAGRSMALA